MEKHKGLSTPAAILCMVAAIPLLPVLIPIAWFQHAADERRIQAAARQTPCLTCGRMLGPESLARAAERWAAHMEQLSREHPGNIFRVVRLYDAICTACGQQYKWQGKTRTFEPLQAAKFPRPGRLSPFRPGPENLA